jgi:hypothetical protein
MKNASYLWIYGTGYRVPPSLNLRYRLQGASRCTCWSCWAQMSQTVCIIVVYISYAQFEKWLGRPSDPKTVIRIMSDGCFISEQYPNWEQNRSVHFQKYGARNFWLGLYVLYSGGTCFAYTPRNWRSWPLLGFTVSLEACVGVVPFIK